MTRRNFILASWALAVVACGPGQICPREPVWAYDEFDSIEVRNHWVWEAA